MLVFNLFFVPYGMEIFEENEKKLSISYADMGFYTNTNNK